MMNRAGHRQRTGNTEDFNLLDASL